MLKVPAGSQALDLCFCLFGKRCVNLLELSFIRPTSVFASDTTNLPLDHICLPGALPRELFGPVASSLKTLIAL